MSDSFYAVIFFLLFTITMTPCLADYSANWTWEDYPYSDYVWYLEQTPDGDYLVTGSRLTSGLIGGCVALFHWQSDIPVFKFVFDDNPVEAVAISNNGSLIAAAVPGTLIVFDNTGQEVWSHDLSSLGYPRSLDFDPTGDLLVFSGDLGIGNRSTGRIALFDGNNGDLIWVDIPSSHGVPEANASRKLQISDDSRWIVGSIRSNQIPSTGRVIVYDLLSPDPSTPSFFLDVEEGTYSSDSGLALNADRFAVNASTWLEYHDLSEPVSGVKDPLWEIDCGGYWSLGARCGISSDGSVVAFHSSSLGNESGYARIFQGSDGTELFSMETDFFAPELNVSPDGSRVAFSGSHIQYDYDFGRVLIWDQQLNSIFCELHTFGPVRFNHTGDRLWAGSGRDQNLIWSQPQLYNLVENDPPTCTIEEPAGGSTSIYEIQLSGSASDPDNDLNRVEVKYSDSVILASPQSTTLENWSAAINLADVNPGPLTIQARAIDSLHKHGQWDSIEVIIQATPTPTSTPTPEPTITPEPTPDQSEPLFLQLVMPDDIFYPGDTFYLDANVLNGHDPFLAASFIALLEVHGEFFCAPTWKSLKELNSIDYLTRDFPVGLTTVEVIPEFVWPDTGSSNLGLVFYALVSDQNISTIHSNIEMVVWGYRTI